jgi:hypothetical protein
MFPPFDLHLATQHTCISGTPFLQGRAFVTASTYSRLLPSDLITQYLTAALDALESSSSGVPLKVAALKAIRKYVRSVSIHLIILYIP